MSIPSPVVFIRHRDAATRHALGTLLRRAGCEATILASTEGLPLHTPHPGPSCLLLEVIGQSDEWRTVQQRMPGHHTPVILLARYLDLATVVTAVKHGVVGVFTTPFREDGLLAAIGEALEMSRRSVARETALEAVRSAYAALSPREREVMALVTSGYLNKQVGGRLGISEITVKAHRGRVMHKMQADSLPALVRMADSLELSPPVTPSPSGNTMVSPVRWSNRTTSAPPGSIGASPGW